MAVIGSLTVKLGLVTVEWDKATAKAKQEAKDLQSAFAKLGLDMTNLKQLFTNLGGAAGLSVAGLTAMSAAIFDMAGKMQDLADATGVSAGKILQFQNALMLAGGKAEDAQTIIGTLFTKIAAAQDGNDTAIAQFEQLGISFEELRRLSPDDALKRVYDGLSNIGNSYEKVKNIKELLGKAGLGKSVDDIAAALGKSTKEFDRQAAALKQWDAMGDALTQTMFNLKVAIAELLAPFTTSKVATVEQFKAAFLAIGSAVVVGQIFNLVAAFKALNNALKGTAALSAALGTMKGGKGLAMGAAGIATYLGVMKALEADEEDKGDATSPPVDSSKPAEELGGKTGGNQAAQMRERLAMLKEQTKYELLRIDLQRVMIGGSEKQKQIAESVIQQEQELSRAASERNQALAKENLTAEQKGIIEAEYTHKVARANELHKARKELIEAQFMQAGRLLILETDQLAERLQLQKSIQQFDALRYQTSEAEIQRVGAQFVMEQKLLQLRQDRQRLDMQFQSEEARNQREYKERVLQINKLEQAARDEYNAQVTVINKNEEIRLQLLNQELSFLEKRHSLTKDILQLETNSRYMTEFEFQKAQEQIALKQRLLDIEQQLETLRTSGRANTPEGQVESQRLQNLKYQAQEEARLRLETIALNEKEAMTWSGGWEKAMREFAQNAQRYGDVARSMFDSVVGNMNSAIDNFVRTGKLNFKDLAKSIIQDLIAIQLKAQAAFLLSKAMGAMGFGGFTAKAGGGSVSQSIPYMVGENGPELFVPQAGGAIIPTQRLGSDMGMGGQTINYNGPYIQNMSAIDTQTASQFLAKNRMAVWSANQSATRSLPQSR